MDDLVRISHDLIDAAIAVKAHHEIGTQVDNGFYLSFYQYPIAEGYA
jgi:hypothetical protein